MTKYDDASWHYEGTYPADLPNEAAATHIGMFVAWCLLNGHASEEVAEDLGDEIEALTQRSTTPGKFLIEAMDEKFISDDLTDEGNAFTVAYYAGENDDSRFIDDYFALFEANINSLYEVPDAWHSYDLIASLISTRYDEWVAEGRPEFIN